MSASARAFRRCDEAGAHPVGDGLPGAFGRRSDERVLVGGEPDSADFGSGILDGRPSGSHATNYSGHRKFRKGLDRAYFSGHNKYMTTTAAKATITTIGQSLYVVSFDRKGNQRVEFAGDRGYAEKLAAYRNGQTR